jgi:hypothetical protein
MNLVAIRQQGEKTALDWTGGSTGERRAGSEEGMLTRRASGLHDRTASTISSKSLYITLSHPSTAAT